MPSIYLKYEDIISKILKNVDNPRTKEIIALRFGLKDGQGHTLEAIGQQYGITRERVRQIEEAAFSYLRKEKALEKYFKEVDKFLNREGGLCRETRLLDSLTGQKHPHPARGALQLVLTLGERYRRLVALEEFYPVWINSERALNQASQALKEIIRILRKKQNPLSLEELMASFKERGFNLSKQALFSYLDASKKIDQDKWGYFGLVEWPEIKPRGAKDKAYIVLKQVQQPLHFQEVTKLINQIGLGNTPAQPQTVHNELIKDNRFVLVGRGTYALREWGHQPGTVKEVIAQILKEKGPLTKEEILAEVLKSRVVKPNTILINLQNRQHFIRDEKGRYHLAENFNF